MIKSILIKNFILIDELFLEFENGFNVLTGETGAGKSIILKAIDTALGAKVQKDTIFLNKEKPVLIELTFLHSKKDLKNLKDFELEEETVISREISQTSQKCRINGALVNLDAIKELREHLVDIHSQNQSYTYVLPKYHIELLDEYCKYCDEEFLDNLAKYENSFKEFSSVSKKLTQLKDNNANNLREIDFLEFQLNEIDTAAIGEGEEENLNSELEILSNIQELKEQTYGIYYSLGADGGMNDALSKMNAILSNCAACDKKLEEVHNAFIEAHENLKFCSDFLREYSQNLEANPQRLNEINERLSLILKLKRKYGDIFEARENFARQLNEIKGDFSSLEELEARKNELEGELNELSQKISNVRKTRADELSDMIIKELKKLEMPKAEFKIDIKEKEADIKGKDGVEFLITTNISSPLAPLSRVASGGEISRVMLAIKTVFAQVDMVSTIIFDEIDTGISGKASNAVAEEISKLSNDIQVFAITHQPTIAARANAHFVVTKSQDDITKVSVKKLSNKEERLEAIASLASGEVNSISVSFAKELLKS